MSEIKAIITDFDGTLADTYQANSSAYRQVFEQMGLHWDMDLYRRCFGLRIDGFLSAAGVTDKKIQQEIRERKKQLYPTFFDRIVLNESLINFIAVSHCAGIKTAIASTANKVNLSNILTHFGLNKHFDYVFAGDFAQRGKPDPEIYIKAMEVLDVTPGQTLVFEDSEAGLEAAAASGVSFVKVDSNFFK